MPFGKPLKRPFQKHMTPLPPLPPLVVNGDRNFLVIAMLVTKNFDHHRVGRLEKMPYHVVIKKKLVTTMYVIEFFESPYYMTIKFCTT